MPVAVGGAHRPLCRERARSSLRQALLCPAGEPIPAGSFVKAVRVEYPAGHVRMGMVSVHWAAAYFVLALVFGLLLKRPFGVEF